jgi:hypothetical protein
MPVFSPLNRITGNMVRSKARGKQLCRGAFGMQSDVQCLGYDSLCALAVLLYVPGEKDASYRAVMRATDEVRGSPYSRAFQRGWDGRPNDAEGEESALGYEDGKAVAKEFGPWRRARPSDMAGR